MTDQMDLLRAQAKGQEFDEAKAQDKIEAQLERDLVREIKLGRGRARERESKRESYHTVAACAFDGAILSLAPFYRSQVHRFSVRWRLPTSGFSVARVVEHDALLRCVGGGRVPPQFPNSISRGTRGAFHG